MIPEARRSQTTTSLLILARAVSDLTRAFIRRLGEAFRRAQTFNLSAFQEVRHDSGRGFEGMDQLSRTVKSARFRSD
jgi:hypothetical protein